MVEWLSPEWAAGVGGLWHLLPPVPHSSGTLSLAFVVAPRSEVAVHWAYEEGKVVSGGAGASSEARLALSLPAGDAADVLSGRVEPSVAFMRGRLKASGDGALLLGFLASTVTPDFEAWRQRVAEITPVPAGAQ